MEGNAHANRLLIWDSQLRRKVKRPLHRRVFLGKTDVDKVFDTQIGELTSAQRESLRTRIKQELNTEVVDFSNENVRGVAACFIGEFLKYSACTSLDLSYNFLRDQDIKNLTKHLHLPKAKLEKLNLSNNRIGIPGAKVLGEVLVWNRSIKSLNLDTNAITASGIECLARSIAKNNYLTTFSVNWNNLQVFAEEFYFTLLSNKTLVNLRLGYCGLKDVAADSLAQGLSENKALRELVLCGNEITDKGGIAFVNCLQDNQTLEYLNLENNMLTDKSGKRIIELQLVQGRRGRKLYVNASNNPEFSESLCEELQLVRDRLDRKKTRLGSVGKVGDKLFGRKRLYEMEPNESEAEYDDESYSSGEDETASVHYVSSAKASNTVVSSEAESEVSA